MKTRSNMPLFVVECTDVKALTDGQIDLLRCGDYLVKKTGNQNHAYKVTYKEDKKGICLTYHDASTVETVSYDYTGGHWVYNSTDKADLPINVEDASFKPIYCHPITIFATNYLLTMLIFNNNPNAFTTNSLKSYLKTAEGRFMVNGAYWVSGENGYYLSPACCRVYEDVIYLLGVDSKGVAHLERTNTINFENIIDDASAFADEVNKIN